MKRYRRIAALAVFGAAAAYLLWTEHRAHVIEALPWVVLLACPLMHLFMHSDHHGHSEVDRDARH